MRQTAPPASVLHVQDMRFRWPGPSGFSLTVPQLQLAPAERVLLLGDSGSGKSTLLSLICGLLLPESGTIALAGQDWARVPKRRRDPFRAEHIGIIFQQFNLLPFATVADNIALPLKFAPERRRRAGPAGQAALQLCRALALPDGIGTVRAGDLSVGQQQRVAVARALIGAPPLIIADEPTSALDAGSQAAFLDLLFAQCAASQAALLMVSHDPRLAERFDRVLRMEEIAQIQRAAA